ncbi:TlpA family protein disulfide reductase [Limnoglobus roseus]|uniref:Thioredoxin domain-containing protein n=1 Tax=Limnoglobus roseus TaxID=2598579 RepID=A0A5C1AIG2_9BACT|nr:thioredoxin family protein [Limnoglobus roseus]QEL19219.1 hypothetical protein PX52LOC_06280 [Limnoglobus roseus]
MTSHPFLGRTLGAVGCSAVLALSGCEFQPPTAPAETPAQSKSPAYPMKVEFLTFTATWCPHCRRVPALLERLRAAAPGVPFRAIDIDLPGNADLVKKFAPKGVPYTVLTLDGESFRTIRGLASYEDTKAVLDDAIATRDRVLATRDRVVGTGQ